MRRPVKPFVTEYKPSSRRNHGASGEQGVFDNDRPAVKPFDFMAKADADDSFEAAMRAADALFSIPVVERTSSRTEPSVVETNDGSTDTPEKSGGRILRVLDEAPPPEYAALEAERAPKRRGRKPGSKNKPKARQVTDIVEIADQKASIHVKRAAAPVAAAPALPVPRKSAAIAMNGALANAAPALAGNGVSRKSGTDAEAPASHGSKRLSWVRDKLKPGEDWKRRRLPKVCW